MAVAVVMPKLGLTMEEGTIVTWLKQENDVVERGETLLEISTEKVNAEIEAPASGVLQGVQAQAGETRLVGATLAIIITSSDTASDFPHPPSDTAELQSPTATEPSAKPNPLVAPQSPPVGSYRPAPGSRPLYATSIAARLAADHQIDLAQVTGTGPDGRIHKRDVEALMARRQGDRPSSTSGAYPLATPIVKRMAQEHRLDLSTIPGSGPDGLIVERDLTPYLTGHSNPPSQAIPEGPVIRSRIPLTGRRKIIAERMHKSVRDIPHIHLSADINMSEAQARRQGASYTALIAWATAQTLLDHPSLNATLDGNELVIYGTVNLGIAVDTEDGLIVPVIHDAHTYSLGDIDAAIRSLSQKARQNKLALPDISNGTFTISNLGMMAVDRFEAIINPPQAAIMAVGRIALRPWALNETTISVCPIMTVTINADHRIVDGATVARFLKDFQSRLE